MSCHHYFGELWAGKRNGFFDRCVLLLLTPPAWIYGMLMRLRAVAYRYHVFAVRKLSCPVVSVGNLTVGGTGKTPMVSYLASLLQAKGKRVCVLSRGYGGTMSRRGGIVSDGKRLLATPAQAGDEPYLLATTVPGLMVVVGADRHAAGLLAEKELAPDLFILDDGFQRIRLHRDLNLLLLDSSSPFGNGQVTPAGPLREPVAAMDRADLVVFTRWQNTPIISPGFLPYCRATHALGPAVSLQTGENIELKRLHGKRVAAFAGIADPDAFFAMLKESGIELVGTYRFPDHVTYGDDELDAVKRLREETAAEVLLTTAKDAVKLLPRLSRIGDVWQVQLQLELVEHQLLENAVDNVV